MFPRSAPEFGAPQQQQGRNSLLRKTQSQPQAQKGKKEKKGKKGSKSDHSDLSKSNATQDNAQRSKGGFPNPLSIGTGDGGAGAPDGSNNHQDLERKTSCPTSPTSKDGDKPKLENKKTAPGALGGVAGHGPNAGGGSPKPKRNIFEGLKNTLRPKSKSQDNSSNSGGQAVASLQQTSVNSAATQHVSGASSHQVYANMHSMPELNVASSSASDSGGATVLSPEVSPSGANSHDRKSSGGAGSVMTSSAEAETTTSAVSH